MRFGYNQPLCLLPFDHRVSYVTGMFHFDPPLTADQRQATDSKEVIYEGFRQAVGQGVPAASGAALNQRVTIFEQARRSRAGAA